MEESFLIHGDLLWSDEDRNLEMLEDGYLLVEDGKCAGVFPDLPETFSGVPLEDHAHCLVLPGMTDLHTHASQYGIRGLGLDEELLVWLKKYTFPEEARFSDLSYAKRMYTAFTEDLLHGWTTRAVIFATLHTESTLLLMDLLEKSGLVTCVGRVNMNRDGGENLCESDAETALRDTEEWLDRCKGRYTNTTPIITPRFIPSCTDDLMKGLSEIAEKYGLRLQSHLSENPGEIELVKKLVPAAASYGAAYEAFGSLLSPESPAVMAHCVYSAEAEEALLMKHGTYIAHCPGSNMNIASGIAPAARFLRDGARIGLGTDIGGGSTLALPVTMKEAMQSSCLYWRLVDSNVKPLSFAETFYMATLGGGSYFGKVGSFLKGYEADAVVIDDTDTRNGQALSLLERLERSVYTPSACRVSAKYVRGRKLDLA